MHIVCRFFKFSRYLFIAALPVLLQCEGCTCTGMIETEESWGAMTFIGDEEHYAIVKHYKKYTTGTSPTEYNGETLEEKEYVYIKNARTGESKQIFESDQFMYEFFPALFDTAICFSVGNNNEKGYVYKYTGELITTYKGEGAIAGWSVPYSRYITRQKGRLLVEKDWAAGTSTIIGESDYCNAQPWGVLNKDAGAFLIKDNEITKYSDIVPNGNSDQWINENQIIKITGIGALDRHLVVRYDFSTGILDTLYDMNYQNVWITVNSTATILIKNKTEIIDLTINGYKK